MGILCKIFIEFYWRKIDEVENVVIMGFVYRRMLDFLDLCIINLYLFLKREILFFYGLFLLCFDVEVILYESFNDDIICFIIKKFCFFLKVKCEKFFSFFL